MSARQGFNLNCFGVFCRILEPLQHILCYPFICPKVFPHLKGNKAAATEMQGVESKTARYFPSPAQCEEGGLLCNTVICDEKKCPLKKQFLQLFAKLEKSAWAPRGQRGLELSRLPGSSPTSLPSCELKEVDRVSPFGSSMNVQVVRTFELKLLFDGC